MAWSDDESDVDAAAYELRNDTEVINISTSGTVQNSVPVVVFSTNRERVLIEGVTIDRDIVLAVQKSSLNQTPTTDDTITYDSSTYELTSIMDRGTDYVFSALKHRRQEIDAGDVRESD